MPRPPVKRRRQNSFVLKKRVNIPDATQARQALEQKLSSKPVGQRPRDSDDSDELVVPGSAGRVRKRQEIFASGAVAKGDQPGAYPTRAQRTRAMRENTVEILSQRSRSASRASSTSAAMSPGTPPKRDAAATNAGSATQKIKLNNISLKAKDVSMSAQRTPQAETSVLGKIKPRKRQASILQLIENDHNHDSSLLDTDDEDQFLPDEVSTPTDKNQQIFGSATKSRTSSLKRKRGLDLSNVAPATSFSPKAVTTASRGLPLPSRSQRRKLNHQAGETLDKEDIMALPESSDEEGTLNEQGAKAIHSPTKSKMRTAAPSTQQLQSLMPSKKHIMLRQRNLRGEFDIPEDSVENTDEDVDNENDHSTFSPSRARNAERLARAKRSKQGAKSMKNKTRTKDKVKSTSTTSYTPSPVRLRTPLPLSSSKSGNTQAKSPSKQDTAMRDKSANTPSKPASTSRPTRSVRKPYGGSQHRAVGKENLPRSLLEGSLPGDGQGEASRTMKQQIQTAETKAWTRKWADIDKFDLDFEEISMSTRSSSPNAR